MNNNDINELKPDRILDVIGYFCLEPIFRTRIEIDKMNNGEILEILADDPTAETDISSWARKTGHEILLLDRINDHIRFLIRKNKK